MNKKKLILLAAVLALVAAFFLLDLETYLSLEYFQARREDLMAFTRRHFLPAALLYFLIYVTVTALSLPAAAVLTLAGGAVFGFWWGLLLASFASSIGATLAFLLARTVLRDWVQARYGRALRAINRGVEKDGAFYLFSLRLVPLFPFFLLNVAMALTPMRALTFYLVSQLGMLPATALYINVGAQLGQATSVPEVISADVLLSLVALALFPWAARGVVTAWRRRRVYRAFPRPRRYDANLVVIGAGAAGLVSAYIAALVKAKVVLIEKHRMGGDCLNTGCVPSKTLIRSAALAEQIRRAGDYGLEGASARVDFAKVMARVRDAVGRIAPHDSVERYEALGVECIRGEAEITSPFTVKVNGREIATRAIVLATGARPLVPPIEGLEDCGYLTTETLWDLRELPRRLLVLGGGAVGCELAQAFARLGSEVTVVNLAPRLLPGEDREVGDRLLARFREEGITVHNGSRLERLVTREGEFAALVSPGERSDGDAPLETAFDKLLLAAGRKPNVEGFGLENLDLPLAADGSVEVNPWLQTRYPNILACGDVAGPYRFTHMAAFQAWYASVNGLFGMLRKFRVNYSVVPWAVFTDPEVARVGLSESEAREREVAYDVCRFGLEELDRAIAEGEADGFVKVLTEPGKDRILGALIVGPRAGELIGEFVTAMTHGLGLKKILATVHIYPTLLEANKYAAGEWRKGHAPQWLYPWLERFHRWRR